MTEPGIFDLKTLAKDDLEPKAGVVIGTRPGIVMFSPVIRALQRREIPFFIVHTGQHYSFNMDAQFMEDLELPVPEYRLEGVAEAKLHGSQTAEMLKGCEQVFLEERPRIVLVGGDTNSNLSGALAARKLQIALGHIESGERSYDWRIPEEHNRRMIDHISDYLFATSEKAAEQLRGERVLGEVLVTGNPIVDALFQNLEIAKRRDDLLPDLGVEPGEYLVLTLHREENVDSAPRLGRLLEALRRVCTELERPLVFPAHPRTLKRLTEFGLLDEARSIDGLTLMDAVGYLAFLRLASDAALVMTDSGGVQQESCILKIPCVTLRERTEWVETVELGANVLAGTEPEDIVAGVRRMLDVPREWEQPFGDGRTGEHIVDAVEQAIAGEPVPAAS